MPAETHVEQGPLDRDEIFEIVRDRLADILEIEPSTISEGQSFVDDLDADSLALIELVEALEEELSERTVGFRIEDEDLADLKTVRDAVDYVYARRPGGRADARRRSPQPDRVRVRRSGAARASRWPTARGAPSTRARSATSAWSSSATPCSAGSSPTSPSAASRDLPEGALTGVRKGVVNAAALAEVAEELDLGSCLLLGRARTPPAAGRSRRSCPTRSRRCSARCTSTAVPPAAYDLIERLIGPRLAETAAQLDQLDHKSRLQELAAGDGVGRPSTSPAPRGPTTPSGSRHGAGRRRRSARATGRSKKAAEQAAAAAACARPRRPVAGAELPEVETVRRGLAAASSGGRIERVEVGRERTVRRTSAQQVDRRPHRRDRRSPPTAAASTCCARSTPATR